jgi:uncharacterized protein (DUF4213/DUF364 family)
MKVISSLIDSLPDGIVTFVSVGLAWTAVAVKIGGTHQCGLASTLHSHEKNFSRSPVLQDAGKMIGMPAKDLARLALSPSNLTEASLGLATINALIPPMSFPGEEINAEEYILRHGADKKVAVIGHFPFVTRMKDKVKQLWVLELKPQEGDMPAEAEPEILPQADIVAMTGTTLTNQTFDGLMSMIRPETLVLMLGPSTPLSSVMFDFGVNVLSGTKVDCVEPVLQAVCQGATFQQIVATGAHLLTIEGKNKRI